VSMCVGWGARRCGLWRSRDFLSNGKVTTIGRFIEVDVHASHLAPRKPHKPILTS
jgi:hypothetical protein